jgi:hypothetical protein
MGKKKKKKAVASLAERLAAQLQKKEPGNLAELAGAEGLSSDEFEKEFEKAIVLVAGPDPREIVNLHSLFQVAFLHIAQQEEDEDFLNDLSSMTADTRVKKEAKRIVHKMKSRGLNVSLADGGGSSILDRKVLEEDPELPCYLTPLAGNGSRMIWLARYVRGGVAVYQAEVNDVDGLVEFSGGVLGRSRYRKIVKEMAGSEQVPLVEISYPEARQRISQSVARSRDASRPLPEGYLEASSDFPEAAAFPLPDPRETYSIDSIDNPSELQREGGKLLDLPEFADWLPDEDTIKALQARLQEVESSTVAINKQQKVEQVSKALDRAVEEMLEDEEKRKRYQDRLFEMAGHLGNSGNQEAAGLAAAAAWQLSEEGFEALQSTFFDRMVKKMFRSAEEIVEHMQTDQPPPADEQKEDKEGGGLIVPP